MKWQKQLLALAVLLLMVVALAVPVSARNGKTKSPVVGSMKSDLVTELDFMSMVDVEEIELEEFWTTYYMADIHLPQIAIDSADVRKINEEIQALAELLADDINYLEDGDFPMGYIANYSIYEDEYILSIEIQLETVIGEPFVAYRVYTIHKDTGEELSNEDILEHLDIYQDLEQVMEDNIYLESKARDISLLMGPGNGYENSQSMFIMESLINHWRREYPDSNPDAYAQEEEVFGGELIYQEPRFYFNSTGALCLSYVQFTMAGSGFMPHSVNVKIQFGGSKLNPIYVLLANQYDLDLEDESIKALIWPLGKLTKKNDYQALALCRKLWSAIRYMQEFNILLNSDDMDFDNPDFEGHSLYLIIPRLKYAGITRDVKAFEDEDKYYTAFDGYGRELVLYVRDPQPERPECLKYRYRDEIISLTDFSKKAMQDLPDGFIIGPEMSDLPEVTEPNYIDYKLHPVAD
ncbi:MAG: hypothetical protein Q4P65_02455 [Eubacteriales bacterium]|nr:hypothetical protein [Eubacteriales bacterium]